MLYVELDLSNYDVQVGEQTATTDGEAISTAYYSVQGERVSSSYRGVVIEVKTMADGSKTVRKTIMK